MPHVPRRVQVLIPMGVVAHRADVVRNKSLRSLRHLVIRNNRIIRLPKALLMHKSKVAHIQKPFNLPPSRGLDGYAVRQHPQVICIFPFRHLRQRKRIVIYQPHPHQTISFLRPIHIQMKLRRDRPTRMRGNTNATPILIVAKPVVPTDNLVAFDMPKAQRNAPVITNISCSSNRPIRQPIHHNPLIQQPSGIRLIHHLTRKSNRIPERGKRPPVRFRKRAVSRQNPLPRRISASQLSSRDKRRRGRHTPLSPQATPESTSTNRLALQLPHRRGILYTPIRL